MFKKPKFWILLVVCLITLPFLALKSLTFTSKKPDRIDEPVTLAACPDSPNCVCSENGKEGHAIEPLTFQGDAGDAWAKLQSVLQELGGEEIRSSEQYLWFEFRTPLIGFIDDVECRLNRTEQQIEIRSASRVGHSDMGANRKRVEAIRQAFGEGA